MYICGRTIKLSKGKIKLFSIQWFLRESRVRWGQGKAPYVSHLRRRYTYSLGGVKYYVNKHFLDEF